MENFVAEGKTMTVTAGANIASGDVVSIGSGWGIAVADILDTEEGTVNITGVYELTKKDGVAFTQGDLLYWDSDPGELTKTAADGSRIGVAYEDAASDAVLAKVLLIVGVDDDPSELSQAAVVAELAGTLTGTVDGTLADVAAVSTAGGNTYADSAINTAITAINLQLKELQTTQNAVIAALKTANLMATA